MVRRRTTGTGAGYGCPAAGRGDGCTGPGTSDLPGMTEKRDCADVCTTQEVYSEALNCILVRRSLYIIENIP